jgi:hypothetical protein
VVAVVVVVVEVVVVVVVVVVDAIVRSLSSAVQCKTGSST